MSTYGSTVAVSKPAGRDRYLVDGVDVTFFRSSTYPDGKPHTTPPPRFQLTEPFGYGPTNLTFTVIHATLEAGAFGQPGELSWVRKGAEVRIQRAMPDGSVKDDYVGVVISVEINGRILNLNVGGQYSGRAALLNKHQRPFRYVGDAGHLASLAIFEELLFPMDPWYGPVTGTDLVDTGSGESLLSWASQVCAMSQDANGIQRTIMPSSWGGSTWTFSPKDYTTKHCTIYLDDGRSVASLVDDAAEQPNAWYGNGVTPEGVRWRNAKYPGLQQGPAPAYPIAGGASFGFGTTDAGTITGDGIEIMQIKMQQESYYPWTTPVTGVFDDATVAAVKRLKADVNLTVNGTMTVTAWNRLWNITQTGFSLNGAKIHPILEEDAVRVYDYNSSGSIVGINSLRDPKVLRVERDVDFGAATTKHEAADWFRGQQARAAGKNWTGTIRLNNWGAISGEHNPGDAALVDGDARILSFRDLRPGWNAWLANFDGGTLVHIAGISFDPDGATLTVDTQARDLLEVAAIMARNTEARRNVRREWIATNRPRKPSGAMVPRDEFFGRLHQKIALNGNDWNVFPVVVGQQGTINRIDLLTSSAAATFAVCVTAKHVSKGEYRRRIGKPLAAVADGTDSWWEKGSNADWFDQRLMLYAAGTHDQPCGYWPKKHTNDNGATTAAPITGHWRDDASFPYIMDPYAPAAIWVAIWVDRNCFLHAGQLLWAQEDDTV